VGVLFEMVAFKVSSPVLITWDRNRDLQDLMLNREIMKLDLPATVEMIVPTLRRIKVTHM
jgi:hypothetical protein